MKKKQFFALCFTSIFLVFFIPLRANPGDEVWNRNFQHRISGVRKNQNRFNTNVYDQGYQHHPRKDDHRKRHRGHNRHNRNDHRLNNNPGFNSTSGDFRNGRNGRNDQFNSSNQAPWMNSNHNGRNYSNGKPSGDRWNKHDKSKMKHCKKHHKCRHQNKRDENFSSRDHRGNNHEHHRWN